MDLSMTESTNRLFFQELIPESAERLILETVEEPMVVTITKQYKMSTAEGIVQGITPSMRMRIWRSDQLNRSAEQDRQNQRRREQRAKETAEQREERRRRQRQYSQAYRYRKKMITATSDGEVRSRRPNSGTYVYKVRKQIVKRTVETEIHLIHVGDLKQDVQGSLFTVTRIGGSAVGVTPINEGDKEDSCDLGCGPDRNYDVEDGEQSV